MEIVTDINATQFVDCVQNLDDDVELTLTATVKELKTAFEIYAALNNANNDDFSLCHFKLEGKIINILPNKQGGTTLDIHSPKTGCDTLAPVYCSKSLSPMIELGDVVTIIAALQLNEAGGGIFLELNTILRLERGGDILIQEGVRNGLG